MRVLSICSGGVLVGVDGQKVVASVLHRMGFKSGEEHMWEWVETTWQIHN